MWHLTLKTSFLALPFPQLSTGLSFYFSISLSRALSPYLTQDLDLTWDIFFRLCLEISGGVAALHGMDPPIVHRDLKSLNLLVDEALSVKVCDFGLSRFTGGGDESTLQKMRGTYAYTAPEVYFGEKVCLVGLLAFSFRT